MNRLLRTLGMMGWLVGLLRLGGSGAHFCQGSLREQERVTFGAPLDTRPCGG